MNCKKILPLVLTIAILFSSFNLMFLTATASDPNQDSDVYFYDDFDTGYSETQKTFNSGLSFNGTNGTTEKVERTYSNGNGMLSMSDNLATKGVEFYKDIDIPISKPKLVLETRVKPHLNKTAYYLGASETAGSVGTPAFAFQRTGGNGFSAAKGATPLLTMDPSLLYNKWYKVTVVYNNASDSRDIYLDNGTTVTKYPGITGSTYYSTGDFILGFKAYFDYDLTTMPGTMDFDYIKLSEYYDTFGYKIVNAESTELNEIDIQFDFPVSSSTVLAENFSIPGATIQSVTADAHVPNRYKLTFGSNLTVGGTYTVDTSNILDISGRAATGTQNFTVKSEVAVSELALIDFNAATTAQDIQNAITTYGTDLDLDTYFFSDFSDTIKGHFYESILAQRNALNGQAFATIDDFNTAFSIATMLGYIEANIDVESTLTYYKDLLSLDATVYSLYTTFSTEAKTYVNNAIGGNFYLLPADLNQDFIKYTIVGGVYKSTNSIQTKNILSTSATLLSLDLADYNTLTDTTSVETNLTGKLYTELSDLKAAFYQFVVAEKLTNIKVPTTLQTYYYDDYEEGAGALPADLTSSNGVVTNYVENDKGMLRMKKGDASATVDFYKDLSVIPNKPKMVLQLRAKFNLDKNTDNLFHYTTDSPSFGIARSTTGSYWVQRNASGVNLEPFQPAYTSTWYDITVVYDNSINRYRDIYIGKNKYSNIVGGKYNELGTYKLGFTGLIGNSTGTVDFDFIKLSEYNENFEFDVLNSDNTLRNAVDVQFNFPVDIDTLIADNFFVSGAKVSAVTADSDTPNKYTLTLESDLASGTNYTITTLNVKDIGGRAVTGAKFFTTGAGYSVNVRTLTDGAEGTLGGTVTAGGTVAAGETYTITATPEDGYEIEYIKYNKTPVVSYQATEYIYTTPVISADAELEVSFKKVTTTPQAISSPSIYRETYNTYPAATTFATARETVGSYTLVEYGMVFSKTDADPEIGKADCIKAQGTVTRNILGQYGIRFTGAGIVSGQTYYTKAYAIYRDGANQTIVYGNAVSFIPGSDS